MLVYKGQNKIYKHDDMDKLRRLIENDYDTTNSTTHLSYRLDRMLVSTGLGDLFDIVNCVITLTIIMFYIISTYTYSVDQNSIGIGGDSKVINSTIDTIETFLCVILICHFILKVYISQNRIYFLFLFDTIIDYGTIIPILLAKQANVFDEDTLHFLRLL
jgi:hypothetical protein